MRITAAGLYVAACVTVFLLPSDFAAAQTHDEAPSAALDAIAPPSREGLNLQRPSASATEDTGSAPRNGAAGDAGPAADGPQPSDGPMRRIGPQLTPAVGIVLAVSFAGLFALLIFLLVRFYRMEAKYGDLQQRVEEEEGLRNVNQDSDVVEAGKYSLKDVERLKEQLRQVLETNRTLTADRDRAKSVISQHEQELRALANRTLEYQTALEQAKSEQRKLLESAARNKAAWESEKSELSRQLEAAEQAELAAIARAQSEMAKFKARLAPEYCSSAGKELYDELQREALDAASPASSAAAYLNVMRSFPVPPSGQSLPSAFLDAVAEFSRQFIQFRRSRGDDESQIESRLNAWAKVVNANDASGITIVVPIVGDGLDQSWMTYSFGPEVKTLRSWCVRAKGTIARKAEVNFR